MRRLTLIVLVVGACLSGAADAALRIPPVSPAAVAAPRPEARAWLIENAATGEVIASHHADQRMPIASITKLMTVLVVLDHHKLSDVVTVDPRVTTVGQESINLWAGERITVRELLEGALIQSANDAADALALSVAPSFPAFAVLMNAKAKQLGLRHSFFVRPDGLDAPGEASTASDVTKLALDAMAVPFIRETVDRQSATISGPRVLHTWNDLLGVLPGVFGVKTGHTSEAGWSQVAAIRGQDVTVYVTILGSPSRAQRNKDLEGLLEWGLDQYRMVDAISDTRAYAHVQLPYGRDPLALVAPKPLVTVARIGRALREQVVAPVSVSLPVLQGQVLGHVDVWAGTTLIGQSPLVASRTVVRPGAAGRIGFYAGRAVVHVLGFDP